MKGIWLILFLAIVSFGCIGKESQIKITPEPTTIPSPATPPIVEVEIAQTTPPTTEPPTVAPTEPPKPVKPVADYAARKLGSHGFDFSALDKDATLDPNDKALIDAIYNIPPDKWEYVNVSGLAVDGIVDDKELAYIELCSKLPEKVNAINAISEKNASLIVLLNNFSQRNPDGLRSLFKGIDEQDTGYVSVTEVAYMEKAFAYGIENVAFDPVFYGSVIDAVSLDKIDEYVLNEKKRIETEKALVKLNQESTKFPSMSKELQDLILSMPWVIDGLAVDEVKYVDSLPTDIDLSNRKKDSDSGGWPDRYEIQGKGDIRNPEDDMMLNIDETDHFKIEVMQNVNPKVIKDILLAAEDAYDENKKILGAVAPKTKINIYRDHETFDTARLFCYG